MKEEESKVIFRIPEKYKADFKIRLKYDNLDQTKFCMACINAYMEEDEAFISWINEMLIKTGRVTKDQSKTKERNLKEMKKNKRNFNIEEFEIDDDRRKSIFDLLESENPNV